MESKDENTCGYYHGVSTTPLIEVFKVTVHGHTNEFLEPMKPCEIYGTITVDNGLGDFFYLYKREEDDPEFIKVDESYGLSLTGPQSDVIIPYEYVTFNIHICDRVRKVIIARGQLELDYKECRYTQYGVESIQGEHSFANLHYATFSHAVLARVDVMFISKDDGFDPIDGTIGMATYYNATECENGVIGDVYGTVIARSDFPGRIDTFSSILFNKAHDQCVKVKSRNYIRFSRHLVAVPAFSPLQINVDFKYSDGSNLASGIATFEFTEGPIYMRDLGGENGRIRVLVKWDLAYEQLCRERKQQQKRTMEQDSSSDNLNKTQKLLTESPCSSQSLSCSWVPTPTPVVKSEKERPGLLKDQGPIPVIEVFSIAIGSNILKPPFKLYGTIEVQDGNHGYIYEKDKSSPESCSDKLLVKGPKREKLYGLDDDFGIYFDLKDVEGHVLSNGIVGFIQRGFGPWYGKRICTLVPGDHGYAALHYAILLGLLAKVKVSVKSVNNSSLDFPLNVYGNLVARYSTYQYTTLYEKKYYQSTLLQKDSNDSLVLPACNSEMQVPLLKSVIAVPKNSALIIQADLTMFASTSINTLFQGVEALQGCVTINIDDKSSKVINGRYYCIEISVQWCHYGGEFY